MPFYIGLVEASWDNDLDFSYTIGKEIPEWKINTGFTFRLPFERISYDLTLKQKFINNFDYTIFDDQMYLGSDVEFAVPIKLKTIDSWGDFVYTPSVQFVDNWAFHSINKRNDDLLSPEILFCNKFSTKNINWQGNFRKGLSFYIRQDYGYNFLIEQIVIGTEAELEGFINFENFAINTRLYGFVYKNKNKKIGNRIRGIRDDEYFSQSTSLFDINSTSTPTSIVLNLDLPIKVFSTNFENMGINFLHKLNFELQISPFIDIALNRNRMTDRTFDLRDGYYCAGIEFIVFPARWKSLQVRASAGFDLGRTLLKDYIDTSWRPNVSPYELSFGIGLHY